MGILKWGGSEKRGGGGRGDGKGHQCMTMLVLEHGPSHMSQVWHNPNPTQTLSEDKGEGGGPGVSPTDLHLTDSVIEIVFSEFQRQ